MRQQLPASRPGYAFATADLTRAGISKAELNRYIASFQQPGQGSALITPESLLAQILRSQKKANSNHQIYAYDFGTYTQQMILGENANRDYLLIQNVGSGDLLVVYQSADRNPSAMTSGTAANLQKRAIRIVGGGYFEPLTVPTNPITIFTINTATNGIVVEGQ